MEILCQTVVGQLDNGNRYCVDWNQLGVLAVANFQSVQLVDSYTMKVLNLIENPRPSSIVKLKWSNLSSNLTESSTLVKLACGDESGFVTIWNTNEMKLINEVNLNESLGTFSSSSVKINDMKWIYNLSNEHLMILFNSNKLLLWDSNKSQKLWSKTLTDSVYQFSIDPHLNGRIAFVGANFIQFMTDCFEETTKEKSLRKFFIMTGSQAAVGSGMSGSSGGESGSSDINKKAINILSSYWRSLTIDPAANDTSGSNAADSKAIKQKQSQANLSECIQIEFHSFAKDILFLVYPKEIFIFELLINQTIGYILLDRQYSPFLQIFSCSQRDALFILHDNGSVSLHVRDEQPYEHEIQISKVIANKETQLLNDESNSLVDQRYSYNVYAQSDQIRMSKNLRLFGFSVCPLTQKDFVVVLNDGRLLSYELYPKKSTRINAAENDQEDPLPSESFLFDILDPKTTIDSPKDKSRLKIALKSVSNSSLPQMPFIVKMCPPLTKKNYKSWEPSLAIGCSNGELLVFNLNRNVVTKRLTLHTHPIVGIEWSSINCLITWSFTGGGSSLSTMDLNSLSNSLQSPSTSSMGGGSSKQQGIQLVKNEILFTDIRTGESRFIRQDMNEESPIIGIKISHLRQYMIILFKEQPFEIWDLRTFSLIKRISKKSPVINILEWCQSDISPMKRSETFGNNSKKETTTDPSKLNINFETISNTSSSLPHSASKSKLSSTAADYAKETFVCVDSNGLLYSFSLEGSQIREGGKVLPEEGLLVNLSSVAVKNDLVLFGDLDGNINKWNVKTQSSSQMNPPVPVKRGEIRKLKFAPGKENLLLLVFSTDNIEIIEASKLEPVSSLKLTLAHILKSNAKMRILDCDWCLSDKLFVHYSNGYIQIYDINFKQLLYNSIKYIPSISTHKAHFHTGHSSGAAPRISQSTSAFSLSSVSLSSLLNSSSAAVSSPSTPTSGNSSSIFFGQYKEMIAMKDLFYRYFSDYESLKSATDNDKFKYLIGLSQDLYFAVDKQARSNLVEYVRNLNRNLKYILFGFMKRFESELSLQLAKLETAADDKAKLEAQLTVATGFSVVFSYLNKNSFESKFWTLFSSVIANESSSKILPSSIDRLNSYFILNSFSSYLIDTNEFKLKEYKILKLFKDKRTQIDKTSFELLLSSLILCSQHELAFNILMETESQSDSYLNNSLKACLLSAIKSSKGIDPNLQSSIKLVATGLIANGKLLEGIELLCLVGLVVDACRYLQDNNQWFKAAWLAKMRLGEADCVDVMKRWSDHLCLSQVNKKDYAVLLLISCKQYARAIEILTETEFYELTHYFLQFCLKNGLVEIKPNEETMTTAESATKDQEKSPLLESAEAPKKPPKRMQATTGGNPKHLSQYIHDKIENNYIRLIKSLE